MIYAKVDDGVIKDYPYDLLKLRKDNYNTSFPSDSMDREDIRSAYGVVTVEKVTQPSEGENNVNEVTPALINGAWTQVWETSSLSAEEIAQKACSRRLHEYGPPEVQLEFITENGLEAWQSKVAEIKAKYPKS